MRLLDKVEKLLRQKRIPQEELARAMLVPPNRISKWKGGQGAPKPHHLLLMARFFGVSLESLVDDAIAEPQPPVTLSVEEQTILYAAKAMGHEEAMRRLVHAPGAAAEAGVAVSWEEPPQKVRRRRKPRASG